MKTPEQITAYKNYRKAVGQMDSAITDDQRKQAKAAFVAAVKALALANHNAKQQTISSTMDNRKQP